MCSKQYYDKQGKINLVEKDTWGQRQWHTLFVMACRCEPIDFAQLTSGCRGGWPRRQQTFSENKGNDHQRQRIEEKKN